MKQFFLVVFGGLTAIGTGIFISYGGAMAWKIVRPAIASRIGSLNSAAAVMLSQPVDGTTISGIMRTIRFSADEEEDILEIATQSLPKTKVAKNVTAVAYLVKNLNSSEVSIKYKADQLRPIASLTKLVTAIIARKVIPANTKISISRDIMATYGNTAQFKVGETFTAGDLLYPLLMVSSNDAAEALARSYDRRRFIEAMNVFTQSIGAYRTYFQDPSGLSSANVSTANDLAIILDWIRRNDPEIIAITQVKSKTVRSHTWVNPTHFLSWSNYAGGKNGYTPEANRTAASLFSIGKQKDLYAVIVLGSDSRDSDELSLLKKVQVE